ncbi:MAG: hypothetical protein O3C43_07440 [Verrucomicrobia bacterium]|nr:hypothetical protein [Verrucomicrobiota bacterium]
MTFHNTTSCQKCSRVLHVALFTLVLLLAACGKEEKQPARPLSESAQLLINPPADSTDAVLLHTIDSATEFPAALNSLDPNIVEPEVRVVQETKTLGNGKIEQVVNVVAPVTASVPLKEDWGGVILVPDMNKMSRGFTSRVTLTRIEAHPLLDDHFRVWVRIRNDSQRDITADVACNFRAIEDRFKESQFIPVSIPAGGSANAYFISPMPHVAFYTILVR